MISKRILWGIWSAHGCLGTENDYIARGVLNGVQNASSDVYTYNNCSRTLRLFQLRKYAPVYCFLNLRLIFQQPFASLITPFPTLQIYLATFQLCS
jgi:hypothetical protein